MTDLLEMCTSAWVDAEGGNGAVPTHSATWYVVTTEVPDELNAEIRARIAERIGKRE